MGPIVELGGFQAWRNFDGTFTIGRSVPEGCEVKPLAALTAAELQDLAVVFDAVQQTVDHATYDSHMVRRNLDRGLRDVVREFYIATGIRPMLRFTVPTSVFYSLVGEDDRPVMPYAHEVSLSPEVALCGGGIVR